MGLLSAKSLGKRFHTEDGRGQKPGRGPRLVGDLSLRGGPRLGTDQKPGRGPKLDRDQSLGRRPSRDGDIRIDAGTREQKGPFTSKKTRKEISYYKNYVSKVFMAIEQSIGIYLENK